jgi:diguanylate cyclase (GGDEF)-like protein
MVIEFFRNVFGDSGDLVVLLAQDGSVAYGNPALRAVLSQARRTVPFMDTVSEFAQGRVRRELVRAAAGEQVVIEIPHPTEEGRDVLVEYRFSPVDDGMTLGIGRVREKEKALGEKLGRAQAELRQKQRILDEIQIELTQVPFIDPVTGVWNRMQVIERLTGEWSRSERWGNPIACLIIEIEGLDELKKHEGNSISDEVLKAVARRIKSTVRDHDIVGRYGESRFVSIAVHCACKGAVHLAERISAAVIDEPIKVAGRTVRVQLRIGCCTNRSDGVEIMEDLFSVAHEALAEARHRTDPIYCVSEDTE